MPVAGGLVTMSRAQSANQEDHLADNVVKCVCEQVAAHTTHTEIDVQSTGREETKTIWSTLSKEIMSTARTRGHGL